MNTFEINAILERLTAQADTFDPEDARRVIAAVPISKKLLPISVTYEYNAKDKDTRGNAAGHGEVNIPGETKRKSYSLNADSEHRIGGYVVTHRKGYVRISLMWARTHRPNGAALPVGVQQGDRRADQNENLGSSELRVVRAPDVQHLDVQALEDTGLEFFSSRVVPRSGRCWSIRFPTSSPASAGLFSC